MVSTQKKIPFGYEKVSERLDANLYILYILQIEREEMRFGALSLTRRYEAMLETRHSFV